ncbi:MAG: hypothetical protein GY797_10320 [Deltaproteobacteria bacterium]|nr:hypothetical protein [Deltaproteobacteria bacterium]
MPDSIQLPNYHTGLFLEKAEFDLEQRYHRLLRRRLNYGLFNAGILWGLELEYDGNPDSVTVKKGAAVDRHDSEMEGREILLSNDESVSITGLSGDQYIVLSYAEEKRTADIKEPTNTPARVTEVAKIDLVSIEPMPSSTDLNIVLGKITIGSALVSNLERQMAKIKSEILPGSSLVPGITVFPPEFAAGTSVATLNVTATGGFDLNGVTASDVTITGSGISNIAVLNNTVNTMDVSFDIAAAASITTRTLTITQAGDSVSATFDITPGLSLTDFQGVDIPNGITHVTLIGTGFSTPATIEFSQAGSPTTVPVPSGNVSDTQIIVNMGDIPSDAIVGQVQVTVPAGTVISSFSFVPPADITGFNTITISVSDILTINGDRFFDPNNTLEVQFAPYNSASTRSPSSLPPFPAVALGESKNISTLEVFVPNSAQTGIVRIVTDGGTVESPSSLTIS